MRPDLHRFDNIHKNSGHVSDEGAASCTACPAGHYHDGNNQCVQCPENTYSTGGVDSCTPCPSDKVNFSFSDVVSPSFEIEAVQKTGG